MLWHVLCITFIKQIFLNLETNLVARILTTKLRTFIPLFKFPFHLPPCIFLFFHRQTSSNCKWQGIYLPFCFSSLSSPHSYCASIFIQPAILLSTQLTISPMSLFCRLILCPFHNVMHVFMLWTQASLLITLFHSRGSALVKTLNSSW